MTENKTKWLSVTALILAMILWSSSFIALKLAFRYYDPMVVIFGRMFVGFICFLPMIKRFKGIRLKKGDLKLLILMAICEPCLYFVLEARALENTSASQAGMITAMLPLLVAVGAVFILKERITRKTFFGFILAVTGVCWLSLGSATSGDAPNPVLGNFYEFLAMVCATGYTIMLKKLSGELHPLFLTAVQAFVGSIFFLPFLFMTSTPMPVTLEPVGLLSIFYLGTFITLGAYGLYNYGLSTIPASQASSFINLIPVFTFILSWLILKESFTTAQFIASGLVFSGVLLSQSKA